MVLVIPIRVLYEYDTIADILAQKSIDKQILLEMSRKNALRDIIKGNSRVEYAWITTQMVSLRERCPRIYEPLIPLSIAEKEKLFAAGATESLDQAYNTRDLTYPGDDLGEFVRPTFGATIRRSAREISEIISYLPTSVSHEECPVFFEKLKQAYARDYKKPIQMNAFMRKGITFVARARATVRSNERHCSFAAGRWRYLKDGTFGTVHQSGFPSSFSSSAIVVKTQAIFVHERKDERRVFLVVSRPKFVNRDNELDTDVYMLSDNAVRDGNYEVIGLSCIRVDGMSSPFLHMIPIVTARTISAKEGATESNVVAMDPVKVSGNQLYWLNPRITKFL